MHYFPLVVVATPEAMGEPDVDSRQGSSERYTVASRTQAMECESMSG
jgi:hypothetical protein